MMLIYDQCKNKYSALVLYRRIIMDNLPEEIKQVIDLVAAILERTIDN
jgi:hypothetical protein